MRKSKVAPKGAFFRPILKAVEGGRGGRGGRGKYVKLL